MIESIHIKNFRGIQDGKIDKFSKINLLVGPNNSGKSAVLEAIYLSNTASRKATVESGGTHFDATALELDLLGNDAIEIVCERHKKKVENTGNGGSISRHFALRHSKGFALHLGRVAGKAALFSMDITEGFTQESEKDDSYMFFVPLGDSFFGSDFVKPEFRAKFQTKSVEIQKGNITIKRKIVLEDEDSVPDSQPEILINRRLVYCWENGLTHYQAGEAAWIVEGQIPSAQNTLFFEVQNTLSHLPFEFFRKMMITIPGWTQKIGRRFGQIFELNKNFNVNFFQPQDALHLTQGYISPEDKIALTIDDYGDGSRSAFKLLTPLIALSELATAEEPGVFIWEEPELFQNPQSLGKLLAEVTQLIKDKPIQLFIATHSIEVIGQFVRLVTEKAIAEDEMLAIRLNLQDGQLSSSAFNHQDIQDWTAMHLDLRVPDGRVDSPLKFQLAEAANDDE